LRNWASALNVGYHTSLYIHSHPERKGKGRINIEIKCLMSLIVSYCITMKHIALVY